MIQRRFHTGCAIAAFLAVLSSGLFTAPALAHHSFAIRSDKDRD
jgi:hypothetical protein